MGLVSSRFIGRAGLAGVGAGLVLLVMPGPASAAGVKANHNGRVGAISCGTQPHLNWPTGGAHQVLTKYSFDINHNGTTTSYCSLFPHVQSGDIVTANFTFAKTASPGDEVTLVSYSAPAANPKVQTLLACASYVKAADGSDACMSASSTSLTVTVAACGFQIDLVYGEEINPNHEGDYAAQRRWIDGMQGGLKNSCPTPTPTATATPTPPTPTPTSNVLGITSTPGGGGLGGVTTPSTGAGGMTPTGLAGSLLVGLGIAGTLFASRRTKGEVL